MALAGITQTGQYNLPDSYISYLIHRVNRLPAWSKDYDVFTVSTFFLLLVISILVNVKAMGKK